MQERCLVSRNRRALYESNLSLFCYEVFTIDLKIYTFSL
jgi:hypothetical protein